MTSAARAAAGAGFAARAAAGAGFAARAVASTACAAAVLAPLAPAAPAAHAAAACTGVAVVVDFRSLGGGAQSGCAAGDPVSGLAALSGAGFGYAFAPSGLVCQINHQPELCPRVPPTTAYWSYWHAQPGGSWVYSNTGAGGYNPAPGSVEGWSFGAGQPPGIAPPPAAAPAPAPAPAPVQPPVQQPAPQPPRQGTPTARGTAMPSTAPGSGAPAQGQPGATPDQPSAGSTAPATTSAGTPSSTAVSPAAQDGAVPPAAGRGLGDTLGLVTGTMLVAGLGLLARWTARRRALPDEAPPA